MKEETSKWIKDSIDIATSLLAIIVIINMIRVLIKCIIK